MDGFFLGYIIGALMFGWALPWIRKVIDNG